MTLPERDAAVAARWLEHNAGLWMSQEELGVYLRAFGLTTAQHKRAMQQLRIRPDVQVHRYEGWHWEYRWLS